MNWDRWEFYAGFDYLNWTFGVCADWEGGYMKELNGRYRSAALTLGPLVIVAAWRV